MASPKGVSDASDSTFPAADAVAELNPGIKNNVEVDPISADIADKADKEEAKAALKEIERKDTMQTLKTTIIVSGVILAVAGAAFAITKKLREK